MKLSHTAPFLPPTPPPSVERAFDNVPRPQALDVTAAPGSQGVPRASAALQAVMQAPAPEAPQPQGAARRRKRRAEGSALGEPLALRPRTAVDAGAPLADAIRRFDLGALEGALATTPPAAYTGDPERPTALHFACDYNDEAAVALLLARGAEPNVRRGEEASPIERVFLSPSRDIVAIPGIVARLLEHGADPRPNPASTRPSAISLARRENGDGDNELQAVQDALHQAEARLMRFHTPQTPKRTSARPHV